MPEPFVPMREWLAPPHSAQPSQESPGPEPMVEAPLTDVAVADEEIHAAIDDAKRFRAALADIVETCVSDLLRDVAADVVARELLIAPCDIRAIVSRTVARYGSDLVRIRLHPDDASRADGIAVPVVTDNSLRSGDVVLETQYGSIDASLGVRLNHVLTRLCE